MRTGKIAFKRAGLALLLLCVQPLSVVGQGLSVERLGDKHLEASAGQPLSLVFRIENAGSSPRVVEGELELPDGWQPLIAAQPISVPAGGSETSILSVSVPISEGAGVYSLAYTAKGGDVDVETQFDVTVQERRRLEVTPLEAPDFVVVGEPSQVRFRVTNAGNRKSRVVLTASSGGDVDEVSDPSDVTLGPNESVDVAVPFTTSTRGSGIVALEASLEVDSSVRVQRAATVPIVPRGDPKNGYHHMPVELRLRLPGAGLSPRPQSILSAAGPLYDSGKERIDLYIRTPSQRSIGIFGAADHYRAAYYSGEFDVLLGDHVYRLSPLTTSGGSFFGGMTSVRFGETEVGALVNRSRWQFFDQGQQAAYVRLGGPESNSTTFHVLNRTGVNAGQIVSVRGLLRDYEMLHVDAEAGAGRMEGDYGAAWQVRMSGKSELVRYTLEHETVGLSYPSTRRGRMTNIGRASWNPTERLELYGRYLITTKDYPHRSDDMTTYHRSRGRAGGRYSHEIGELRLRLGAGLERAAHETETPASYSRSVSHALRLEGTAGYRSLGLNTIAEIGVLDDDWIGRLRSFQDITVQASFQPTARHAYNAFVHLFNGAMMNSLANYRNVTINFSGFYRPTPGTTLRLRSSLGLRRIAGWERGFVLRGDVEHRLPNGHEVELGLMGQKFLGADLNRTLFVLSYAIPLQIPITPSRTGGRLTGSVIDTRSDEGVADVRVYLGERVALTDKKGRFEFAGLESGAFRLELSRGDLGLDVVPIEPLPRRVQVKRGERRSVRIDVTAAAQIRGKVEQHAYTTEGRLAKDRELVSRGGLRNVIVELMQDSVRFQQVTNRLGEFTFAGLAPGTWTLRVVSTSVPPEHDARPHRETFELEAGGREAVTIDVVPRIRRIRFVQPSGQK